jgi:gamma-glutamylputrescine oxidase
VQRFLRRDLLRVFPQLDGVKVDYAWSGLMSYARHQMPQLGSDGQGLWWAQAFGGHGLAPTCAVGELLAAAIADGDEGWKQFADYGLASTHKPLGFLAAQANYWWQEGNDWLKTRLEG